MAASKFLALVSGRIREVLSTVTSTGAADDGKIVALGSDGRLDNSIMPVGIGNETKSIQASENLSAGDLVNIWSSASEFRVRKADATTSGKEANGFVLSSVNSGSQASVYLEGTITGLSGLTPGRYYLSATPGQVTLTPPASSGNVVQYVGNSLSSSEITFEPTDGVILV
jgi:Tfp pilus assembly protein PilW